MWQVMKQLDFESTHGAFLGTEIRDKNVKRRVLESMKIQAGHEAPGEHAILREEWPSA